MALMELLEIDNDIDELIAQQAGARKIRDLALRKNFRPLADEAVRLVLEGVTSLAEVSRVIDLASLRANT